MGKNLFAAVVLACLVVFGANVCSAGTFQVIYNAEKFSADLKRNQAVDETFNTNDGKVRLQLRKLANSSAEKRMHVLGWVNDKRVYEEYFPDVYGEYTFRVIKNTADSRQFYVIQSYERAVLIGYSPAKGQFETYIDSKNYFHDFQASPFITATKNGDLILAFENSQQTLSARYHFYWDDQNQWFAYKDLGTYKYSIVRDSQ